jgi:quercetin dioxygenase-like cupin family protein
MKIIACGSVPTIIAPDRYFTGRVLQTPIIEKEGPARLRATLVSFEPGARTHCHTHPLGQTLYVAAGAGSPRHEADQSRRSGPATLSRSRPARSIGTARARTRP